MATLYFSSEMEQCAEGIQFEMTGVYLKCSVPECWYTDNLGDWRCLNIRNVQRICETSCRISVVEIEESVRMEVKHQRLPMPDNVTINTIAKEIMQKYHSHKDRANTSSNNGSAHETKRCHTTAKTPTKRSKPSESATTQAKETTATVRQATVATQSVKIEKATAETQTIKPEKATAATQTTAEATQSIKTEKATAATQTTTQATAISVSFIKYHHEMENFLAEQLVMLQEFRQKQELVVACQREGLIDKMKKETDETLKVYYDKMECVLKAHEERMIANFKAHREMLEDIQKEEAAAYKSCT